MIRKMGIKNSGAKRERSVKEGKKYEQEEAEKHN